MKLPVRKARGFFCFKISASLNFSRLKDHRKLRFLVAGFTFISRLPPGTSCEADK